ncbi:MAG: DNA adenine methylase [Myxococcota bacterium]
MIKYLGSKRKLLGPIAAVFADLPPGTRVLDLFSGTSRVSQALKKQGLYVCSNDHNLYAHTIARCYIEADAQRVRPAVTKALEELTEATPQHGWFTKTYCEEARFFHPDNGAIIEGMRHQIDEMELEEPVRSIVLVALMEAADRVDSTTGLQMAYLKQWAARAHKPLQLRVPELLDGSGSATCLDAIEAAKGFRGKAAYLDPPYNQHSYRSNYHIWETLIRWDNPEVYGVARKRIDCKTEKSDFNSRRRILSAFCDTVENLDVDRIVVSFNNEGYLERTEIEKVLSKRGTVHTIELDHKRYVGAQIGIHNQSGKKVGAVSHLRNKELLFVVGQGAAQTAEAARAERTNL